MIAENVKKINELVTAACLRSGREPSSVAILAVSKTFSSSWIREAAEAGIRDFGENYVQEFLKKYRELQDLTLRWHFVGHLQTNKVKSVINILHLIHSVDSLRLGEEISKRAVAVNRIADILVEVNTSGEPSKFGVPPEETADLIKALLRLPHLRVRGLMTIGPLNVEMPRVRQAFRTLRELRDESLKEGFVGEEFRELSMGMSSDFEIAIEEGATIIRLGTAIFGPRRTKNVKENLEVQHETYSA